MNTKLTLPSVLKCPEANRLEMALVNKAGSPKLRALDTPENTLAFMKACLRGSYLFGRHLVPSYTSHAFAWLTGRHPTNNDVGRTLRRMFELCIGELCTNNIYNRPNECHAHFHDLQEACIDAGLEMDGFDYFFDMATGTGTMEAIERCPSVWSPGSARYAGQLLICCDDPLATFIVMVCNELLTTIIYPVALEHLCKEERFNKFRRFLEVHVQLDGDDHGYAALEWLELYLNKKHLPEQRIPSATSMVRASTKGIEMKAWLLPNTDVSYLNDILLNDKGLLKVLPYSVYTKIDMAHLQAWAGKHGVYTFPTTELIDWIHHRIGGRKAIEICAGMGVIGRALKIVITDSYNQCLPEMKAYYKALGQECTDPPSDVYQFEANEAVDTLKPKVVVASYATQKYLPGDEGPPPIGSSVYGVDELAMLPKIQTYIFVGSDMTHGDKRICQFPHETIREPWIVTRGLKQKDNFIKVWG